MPASDGPVLAVSLGDPAGVGPDVCAMALGEDVGARLVLVGDIKAFRERAAVLGLGSAVEVSGARLVDVPAGGDVAAGRPNESHARAVLASIDVAVGMAVAGDADGIVTGPVSKAVLASAEPDFIGQTEYVAKRACVARPVMAMIGKRLRVALVTTHLPLARVPDAVTPELVCETLVAADRDARSRLGVVAPRWTVLGLNPHAGEQGLLGSEDEERIAPGIAMAVDAGVDARGPVSADTAFLPGALGERDLVLAMYHDQALPVVKRDDFYGTVNATLGLPFVRTSPDHGTAFSLAGTGDADPRPMLAAISLAAKMAVAGRVA